MVWGAISYNRKSDLVVVRGNLTAQRYINDVLEQNLLPIIDRSTQILQQDNARPHTARVTMGFLEENDVNVLPWPYKSPDLNPIEHLWDALDRRLRQRQPQAQTLQQLATALQEEWENITQQQIQRLIRSCPRRVRSVIAPHGGHTRY